MGIIKPVLLIICTLLITACEPEELETIAINADAIIIDVREQYEFLQGHIPGAILLPLDQLEEEISLLVPDLDQIIYLYCRSGRRSSLAANILAEIGYTAVFDLGGVNDWRGEIVVP